MTTDPLGREVLVRTGARVLLVDGDGRVLLMRGHDPAEQPPRRYWFTVGGGLEPGEDDRRCAVRELHEETGLRVGVDDVLGPLWHEDVEFGFDRWWVRQAQRYYAVRVELPPGWVPAPAGLEPGEAATVDRWAWWSVDQIRAQAAGLPNGGPGEPGEVVYPAELPDLLAAVSSDGCAPTSCSPAPGGCGHPGRR